MHPFALSRAVDASTAIATHAADPQIAFIAGGTDLLGLIRDRAVLPERLLDINGLRGMARIEALPDGSLRIGALARMSDVAAHLEVRRRFPRRMPSAVPLPVSCTEKGSDDRADHEWAYESPFIAAWSPPESG